MMTAPSKDRQLERLLDDQIEPFLQQLQQAGYAQRTLRKKRTVVRAFARWAKTQRIGLDFVSESHISAFVARPPRRPEPHVRFELAVMRLFLEYLRREAGLPFPVRQSPDSPVSGLLRRYESYLRKDRGLAENSVHVYVPLVRDFLASQITANGSFEPHSWDTLSIRDFILRHTRKRSAEYVRLLATALRSFFRFLFMSGFLVRELARSVPRVCKYRGAVPPAFLAPEEIRRVLAATDRSTPTGRRDYAILLLLARLGLRAGEIVTLELRDIGWRKGEILIRGKGRVIDQLPLLRDVGQALALYLQKDRGVSSSRLIFLRRLAPRTGLAGPAAVGHIVRAALTRAGIRRSGRGAAHLFRHGLATRMIRHGASITEIAEVLRHRSQITTAAYSQVAFEALRGVAQPWPAMGGIR